MRRSENSSGINVLVNNAAVLLPGTAESLSEEDFDQTFASMCVVYG